MSHICTMLGNVQFQINICPDSSKANDPDRLWARNSATQIYFKRKNVQNCYKMKYFCQVGITAIKITMIN